MWNSSSVRRKDAAGAGAGHHLVLATGVVEPAVPVRHGLHRAAGHRSAERYALELRHDLRQQPVRECAAYDLGERRSRLRGARARFDVDVEHRIQRRDVHSPAAESRVAGLRHEVMHAALVDMDGLLQRSGGADLLTHRLDLGLVRTRHRPLHRNRGHRRERLCKRERRA